jgi:hypothetical protein
MSGEQAPSEAPVDWSYLLPNLTSVEPLALPNPTPVDRLTTVEAELDNLTKLLEHLWLERNMLYSAIRELKTVKRNVELARASLTRGAP